MLCGTWKGSWVKSAVIIPSVPLSLPGISDPVSLVENVQKFEEILETIGNTETKKRRFEPDKAEPLVSDGDAFHFVVDQHIA